MSTKRTRTGTSWKKRRASNTGTSYPGVIDRAKVSRGRERPSNEENLPCILKDFLSPSMETRISPSKSSVTKYQNSSFDQYSCLDPMFSFLIPYYLVPSEHSVAEFNFCTHNNLSSLILQYYHTWEFGVIWQLLVWQACIRDANVKDKWGKSRVK